MSASSRFIAYLIGNICRSKHTQIMSSMTCYQAVCVLQACLQESTCCCTSLHASCMRADSLTSYYIQASMSVVHDYGGHTRLSMHAKKLWLHDKLQ